jgi:ferredoxin-NADP reductase
VLREPQSRGGSVAMIDNVRVGDQLRIGVPRNHFTLASESKTRVAFGGGIGITPILSMAESLASERIPFRLIYANRSRSRTAFLEHIKASRYVNCARFHFDDESDGRTLDLKHSIGTRRADSHLYVCGPPGFIKAALGAAEDNGWPSSSLHREYFQPLIGDAPSRPGRILFALPVPGTPTLSLPNGRLPKRSRRTAYIFPCPANKACAEPALPECLKVYPSTMICS